MDVYHFNLYTSIYFYLCLSISSKTRMVYRWASTLCICYCYFKNYAIHPFCLHDPDIDATWEVLRWVVDRSHPCWTTHAFLWKNGRIPTAVEICWSRCGFCFFSMAQVPSFFTCFYHIRTPTGRQKGHFGAGASTWALWDMAYLWDLHVADGLVTLPWRKSVRPCFEAWWPTASISLCHFSSGTVPFCPELKPKSLAGHDNMSPHENPPQPSCEFDMIWPEMGYTG